MSLFSSLRVLIFAVLWVGLKLSHPLTKAHESDGSAKSPEEDNRFELSGTPSRNNIGFRSFQDLIMTRNKNRLLKCPGMVGPVDGKFYCQGIENGYCDRRSGACFCNKGYDGVSCNICDPYNFLEGGLCYEKKPCPNACSSGGSCDVKTGRCTCYEGREGDDCSRKLCTVFHKHCTKCNTNECLDCVEGWTAVQNNPMGSKCVSCHNLYDPRCNSCNATSCNSCQDLLLLSIHRSGRRDFDPELPFDETNREFGITVPFGSQQLNSFDEAQHYFLASAELTPLKSFSVSCDQGLSGDPSFECKYIDVSNVLCGNYGVITFSRPHYEVREGDGFVRLQIKRSGGGVGKVNVSYAVEHITTDDTDVSPTAYYTDSQTVTFGVHEVQKSFLFTIHDDVAYERNESFTVYLFDPTNPAKLGSQSKTTVTIIDDDNNDAQRPIPSFDTDSIMVFSNDSTLSLQYHPHYFNDKSNDDIYVYFSPKDSNHGSATRKGKRKKGADGTFMWYLDDIDDANTNYTAHVIGLKQNGLIGLYFENVIRFGIDPFKTRTDRTINFTAFESGVKCVRWKGFLKPSRSGLKIFSVLAKKSRLWIDEILIIDEWIQIDESTPISSGCYHLNADEVYAITLEVEVGGNEPVKLFWGSKNTSMKIIQPKNFYFHVGYADFEVSASSRRPSLQLD